MTAGIVPLYLPAMHTVRHRFQEVTRSRKVAVVCAGCGKPRVRTVTVTHTINPFNKNDDGTIRSPHQVAERVAAELASLVRETTGKPIICKPCGDAEDAAAILQRAAKATPPVDETTLQVRRPSAAEPPQS